MVVTIDTTSLRLGKQNNNDNDTDGPNTNNSNCIFLVMDILAFVCEIEIQNAATVMTF